ncbi:MAG: hypothetical protein AB8C46_20540 [Burkholderiaceae bacterium]
MNAWAASPSDEMMAIAPPIKVAEGILLFPGTPGPAAVENGARQANIALVSGPQGALAWNAGVTHRHGQTMLQAMLETLDVPVRGVVISHAYQDVLFGWSAFREVGIDVVMHKGTEQLMHQRCQGCLDRLTELLGPSQLIGTQLAEPNQIISGPMTISSIGRKLDLLDEPHGAGPSDLMMFDKQTGTLFSGAAVFTNRVGSIQDGRLNKWISMLESVAELPIKHIVPDYGSIGNAESIQTTLRYLRGLEATVGGLLKRGITLADAADNAAMPEFSAYGGYDEHHSRNVHHLYLRMESRFFE